MYVKVYISRMEMSQRIHFWHQDLPRITIFEKVAKIIFLFYSKHILTALKHSFELKMLKLHENHLKPNVEKKFSHILILDQKVPKCQLLPKNHFFWHFLVKI